ncbi:hypothetical protein AG1IA_00649 [Rhizoctonia solani AG-1 IA]|uniref:Uncharacterized protein n=1 Tax=Thanatephorus cucumeris (strain AG1-IA) TaxID=983506 RepID=L8X4V9_THACA|nr:hypothetical protein AG1IA_00649 [Rhizoctonia solani AG-1 IA]
MFDSQLPDETRPSVIGDGMRTTVKEGEYLALKPPLVKSHCAIALFLEMKGRKLRESNPNEARTTLVAAALGYHCHGHRDDAHTIQIQIGWILIDQQQFQAAQAHFEAVRGVANGDLIVACKRGLARTAVGFGNFDEATMQYGSALALCREGRFTDYEYMIIRETANAILGHPKNQGSPEENLRSRNMARELFKEALSLSMDPERTNLEYQVRVRCDLVQLERDAGNKSTAQSHALSAFRCALKTGQQNIAEEVYNYLLDSEVLSEAQYSAFYMELLELRPNNAKGQQQARAGCFTSHRLISSDLRTKRLLRLVGHEVDNTRVQTKSQSGHAFHPHLIAKILVFPVWLKNVCNAFGPRKPYLARNIPQAVLLHGQDVNAFVSSAVLRNQPDLIGARYLNPYAAGKARESELAHDKVHRVPRKLIRPVSGRAVVPPQAEKPHQYPACLHTNRSFDCQWSKYSQVCHEGKSNQKDTITPHDQLQGNEDLDWPRTRRKSRFFRTGPGRH